MATRTLQVPAVDHIARATRRSYHFAREAPLLPLLILVGLGLSAIFAPIIAPYEKL
jgi:hypothetical protein